MRGVFCAALLEGPGFGDTVEGSWINDWLFAGGAGVWLAEGPELADTVMEGWNNPWVFAVGASICFADGAEFADTVEGAWFAPYRFSREPEFGLPNRLSEEDCLVAYYSQ